MTEKKCVFIGGSSSFFRCLNDTIQVCVCPICSVHLLKADQIEALTRLYYSPHYNRKPLCHLCGTEQDIDTIFYAIYMCRHHASEFDPH